MLYKSPKLIMQNDIKIHRKFRYVSVSNTLSGRRVKFIGYFCEHGNEHSNHTKPFSRTSSKVTIFGEM